MSRHDMLKRSDVCYPVHAVANEVDVHTPEDLQAVPISDLRNLLERSILNLGYAEDNAEIIIEVIATFAGPGTCTSKLFCFRLRLVVCTFRPFSGPSFVETLKE